MPTRRSVLLGGVGVAGGLAVGGGLAAAMAERPDPSAQQTDQPPLYTFASMPDFFNVDVGDVSTLPTWDGGENSLNPSWQAAIDQCLGVVMTHEPQAILIAGDAVEGHWNMDSDNRQLFGPVSQGIDEVSLSNCRAAITTAGGVYYGYHNALFAARNVPMYPAVGDHELLDDRHGPLNSRWSPSGYHDGKPDNRYYLVEHCKSVWADHHTKSGPAPAYPHRPVGSAHEFTAYRVDLGPALTLITVDMFHVHPGGVRLGVFGPQLRWLNHEIRRAKSVGRVVIVQGHIPVLTPYRLFHSGNLHVPEGANSAFYRVLDSAGADFFFCGEVHDSTLQKLPGGPVQLSHGCAYKFEFNFVIGKVYPGQRVTLDLYEIPLVGVSGDTAFWQSAAGKRTNSAIDYGAPVHAGTVATVGRRVIRRTGKLGHYNPASDPWAYSRHLDVPTPVVQPARPT